MLVFEAQVLEFGLYLVQSEPVGKRRVDVESLSGNLVLLVCRLALKRPHVVKAVAYFYQDDPYVVAHREQQLLDVLRLSRRLFTEYAAGNLCQSVDNLCDLASENVLDVLNRVVSVLYNVVQECRADACRAEPHLLACYLRHGDGVEYVRFARQAAHALVCLSGEVERLCYYVNLLAVTC